MLIPISYYSVEIKIAGYYEGILSVPTRKLMAPCHSGFFPFGRKLIFKI